MALIRFTKNQVIPYIPKFDRKTKDKPLTIYIKYVPAGLYDEYMLSMGDAMVDVKDTIERRKISKEHDKNIFVNQIEKIENFFDEGGKPINDVCIFYDSIDYNLRSEILDAMMSQAVLTEHQRKN